MTDGVATVAAAAPRVTSRVKPEARWTRMRAWVEGQIRAQDKAKP